MPTPSPDASGWEDALLAAIGAPITSESSLTLSLWAASEGMPAWANNWLATERGGYGGTKFNSAGVWAYPTFTAGIAATAATLKQTNMSGILSGFRERSNMAGLYLAINTSPWCPRCQGGHYPEAVYNYLLHLVGGTPAPGTFGGFPVQGPTQPPDFDWSRAVRQTADVVGSHKRALDGYARAIGNL